MTGQEGVGTARKIYQQREFPESVDPWCFISQENES